MKYKIITLTSLIIAMFTVSCGFGSYAISVQPRIEQAEFGISMLLVCHTGNDIRSSPEQGAAFDGHSFLFFHNESTYPVRIGHMTVQPDDYVTVGTFGNRSTHVGIWYNIEAHVRPSNCMIISHYISTEDELAEVNDQINGISSDSFSEDDNGFNSADFAIAVWNRAGPFEFTGNNNSNSELQQMMYAAHREGFAVDFNYTPPYKSASKIAYQTATSVAYSEAGINEH